MFYVHFGLHFSLVRFVILREYLTLYTLNQTLNSRPTHFELKTVLPFASKKSDTRVYKIELSTDESERDIVSLKNIAMSIDNLKLAFRGKKLPEANK